MTQKQVNLHICTKPVWENNYYWDTLYALHKIKTIDITTPPAELRKYTTKDLKKALQFAEKQDRVCERITQNKWKWNKEE